MRKYLFILCLLISLLSSTHTIDYLHLLTHCVYSYLHYHTASHSLCLLTHNSTHSTLTVFTLYTPSTHCIHYSTSTLTVTSTHTLHSSIYSCTLHFHAASLFTLHLVTTFTTLHSFTALYLLTHNSTHSTLYSLSNTLSTYSLH
jgi:hypothetical protein